MRNYLRLFLTILASTTVMFGLMYLNTFDPDHVRFSETRLYMALLMGAAMGIVMLVAMGGMYRNARANAAWLVTSALVGVAAVWLVRSQRTIDDVAYMRAMIPHHSIAILTSDRARISDPRVRDLANRIRETQREEIAEMERLIASLEAQR